jgi:FtsH-binding integral membrane protein
MKKNNRGKIMNKLMKIIIGAIGVVIFYILSTLFTIASYIFAISFAGLIIFTGYKVFKKFKKK